MSRLLTRLHRMNRCKSGELSLFEHELPRADPSEAFPADSHPHQAPVKIEAVQRSSFVQERDATT